MPCFAAALPSLKPAMACVVFLSGHPTDTDFLLCSFPFKGPLWLRWALQANLFSVRSADEQLYSTCTLILPRHVTQDNHRFPGIMLQNADIFGGQYSADHSVFVRQEWKNLGFNHIDLLPQYTRSFFLIWSPPHRLHLTAYLVSSFLLHSSTWPTSQLPALYHLNFYSSTKQNPPL